MKFESVSYAGKPGFNALCPEKDCKVKCFGTDKSKAKKAVQAHDREVHKPVRDKAAEDQRTAAREKRDAERQAKAEDGVAVLNSRGKWEIIKDLSSGKLTRGDKKKLQKIKYQKLKGQVGSHNASILSKLDDTPASQIPQIKGLHTHGIPGVPDGQNINGLVYDKDGNRITHDVLKRYVQGWGD